MNDNKLRAALSAHVRRFADDNGLRVEVEKFVEGLGTIELKLRLSAPTAQAEQLLVQAAKFHLDTDKSVKLGLTKNRTWMLVGYDCTRRTKPWIVVSSDGLKKSLSDQQAVEHFSK